MSESPDISANIQLDLSQYQRSIRQGVRAASKMDDALDSIVDAAARAEKQLQAMSSDIAVKLDTDFGSVLDAGRALDGLETTISPLIDISVVNDSATRALLDDFNSSLNPKINVETSELENAQRLLDRLDAPVQTKLNVDDSAVDTAKRKVDDLDSETIDTKVNVDDSELAGIKQQLETLKQLAVIDLVMNVAGLPEQIPLLGAAGDQDKARRTIAAGTGGNEALTAQYAAEAEDVYSSNFGADRLEVATNFMSVAQVTKDATGELAVSQEELGEITKGTYTTAINLGEDFNTVLAAEDQLVRTGLVSSYGEALDLINTGAQQGLNRNNDLLDSIGEYAPFFAKAGISAEQMFSIFDRGLENSSMNLDYIGDLVKEMDIRIQAAGSGEGTEFEAFKALDLLDLVEAYNAGEDVGAEILQGVIDGMGEVPPQVIFDALGTKAEDITIPVLMKLNPTQVKEEFAQYDGTTVDVAAQLGGDMGSSIEAAKRKIESELASAFSKAFDIPGKIQQLSDGVSKMSELIDLGASIPEAIEVAFQIPGFSDTIAHLESTLGNLGITFMEVAASILDVMGKGEAAAGVRATIADKAEGQLTFDLKLANDGGDISQAVTTALNRGVADSDVQASLVNAGREMMATGDMTGAQAYLGVLQDIATIEMSPGMLSFLSGKGIDPTNLAAVSAELNTIKPDLIDFSGIDYQALYKEGQTSILPEIDLSTTAQAAVGPMTEEFTRAQDAITGNLEAMRAAAEQKLPGIAEIATSSLVPMTTQATTMGDAFVQVGTDFSTATGTISADTAAMGGTLTAASGYVSDFAGNADVQFGETTVMALDSADQKMLAFGETVLNTMLQANADVQALIDKLLAIGSLDIALPSIGGPAPMAGGQPVIPGQSVGGQIEAGTLAKVHAEELLYAGGQDISVLNRQTSSVIDNALSALVGGGGGGGATNVYNNQVYNVVINNAGAAAATATMESKALRGF